MDHETVRDQQSNQTGHEPGQETEHARTRANGTMIGQRSQVGVPEILLVSLVPEILLVSSDQ